MKKNGLIDYNYENFIKKMKLREKQEILKRINDYRLYLYDFLIYCYDEIDKYYQKLFSCGLDDNDYEDIFILYYKLKKLVLTKYNEKDYYKDDFEEITRHIINLKEIASYSSLKNYLKENCSLTHLYFTNNKYSKIKIQGLSDFFFKCQHHIELKPSLSIFDIDNYSYCYGCGNSYDPISYLREKENISEEQAISLLKNIYLIDNENFDEQKIVEKYHNSLVSEEFKELLMKAKKRNIVRINKIEYFNKWAKNKIDKDLKTIKRIRDNVNIDFNKEKQLILK